MICLVSEDLVSVYPPLPAAVVSRVTREAEELGSVKFAKIKLRFNGPDPILWL